MSILDANRKFSAAMLYLAASTGNWSPYYLAYAWLTGAIDPRAAYDRDGGALPYLEWSKAKFEGRAPSDPDLLTNLADEISANAEAWRLMREYALLHGQRRVTA
jgi:hypothetical protein